MWHMHQLDKRQGERGSKNKWENIQNLTGQQTLVDSSDWQEFLANGTRLEGRMDSAKDLLLVPHR